MQDPEVSIKIDKKLFPVIIQDQVSCNDPLLV